MKKNEIKKMMSIIDKRLMELDFSLAFHKNNADIWERYTLENTLYSLQLKLNKKK